MGKVFGGSARGRKQRDKKRRSKRSVLARLASRRPQVETLEDRRLLAVDFTPGPLAAPSTNRIDTALGLTGSAPVEPTIVVSATDPGNVVASSHSQARISTNAGVTFATTVNFTNPPGATTNRGDTDMVFDSQGRLFWSNLASGTNSGFGISVNEINATTGANISATNLSNANDDKEFITADQNPNSPFRDNLYLVWTSFGTSGDILFSRSIDQGVTWSAPINMTNGAAGFDWPSDVGVAPNGDVYVAWHTQPGFNGIGDFGGNPDGTSGQILVRRSTDGGQTFAPAVAAFGPGQADTTYNIQNSPGNIPGTDFWMQGQPQPWVTPDPTRPGNIYIIASDDPDNVHGTAGDDVDIVISRSADNGATWTQATIPVDPPGGSHQFFPTAAIDEFGTIVVSWYDTRNGATNPGGNFLLDVFATYSIDGGLTWAAPFQINDPANAFDPDIGAGNRTAGPPPTTRIGEYFGVDIFGGMVYTAWNGPNPIAGAQTGHQVLYDSFAINGRLTVSGDESGSSNDDQFVIQRMADDPDFVEVFVNGQRQYVGLLEGLHQIEVLGLSGNDTLTVDSTNGLITLSEGIHFDGGGGFDRLDMRQTSGSPTSETVHVGQTPGDGVNVIVGPGGMQTVQFENLEPFTTNVPAADFNITSVAGLSSLLQDDNQINYSDSPLLGATWGRVTVDNFEFIDFTNKDNLTIDAGAGSDLINLNHPANPTGATPGGLKNINVNGDDTIASDRLLIQNLGLGATIDYTSARRNSILAPQTAIITGAQVPTVNATTMEAIHIEGQGGNIPMVVNATSNSDIIEFTPGPTLDSGTIRISELPGGISEHIPLTFANFGEFGSVTLNGAGGSDTLVYNGTTGNDTFDVAATGTVDLTSNFGNQVSVLQQSVENLTLVGHAGDDSANINAANPYATLRVEGGDPSAGSDVLNFTGSGASGVILDLAAKTITELGFGPVSYAGVEQVNIDANNMLTVNGTGISETFNVTPLGPDNSGSFTHSLTSGVTFNYSNASVATFGGNGGEGDELRILGDGAADFATVRARSIEVDGSVVTFGNNLESLTIDLFKGDDNVTVDNSDGMLTLTTTYNGAEGRDSLRLEGSPRYLHRFVYGRTESG